MKNDTKYNFPCRIDKNLTPRLMTYFLTASKTRWTFWCRKEGGVDVYKLVLKRKDRERVSRFLIHVKRLPRRLKKADDD